jgi:membrane protein implicated in regulation of membrane protease activity
MMGGDLFFWWIGAVWATMAALVSFLLAMDWAVNRALRLFGVYREVVAFALERARQRRNSLKEP